MKKAKTAETAETAETATAGGAGGHKVTLMQLIEILSCGVKSVVNGMLPNEVVLSNKDLRDLVRDGRLMLNRVTLVVDDPGPDAAVGAFKTLFARIQDNLKKRLASESLRLETLVSVRATTPSQTGDRGPFYNAVGDLLREHAGTIKTLDLTLKMPRDRKVLTLFLGALQMCKEAEELRMDASGIVCEADCDRITAHSLEATVGGLASLVRLIWTGMLFLPVMPENANGDVLLMKLPPTIESVALCGAMVSHPMGVANMRALTMLFETKSLDNLVHVDLSGYAATNSALKIGRHLYAVLGHESSKVEKVTMPATWEEDFYTSIDESVLAVAARGEAMLCTGRRFTLVVSNTDEDEKDWQMKYLETLLRSHKKLNVTVEFPNGRPAGRSS